MILLISLGSTKLLEFMGVHRELFDSSGSGIAALETLGFVVFPELLGFDMNRL